MSDLPLPEKEFQRSVFSNLLMLKEENAAICRKVCEIRAALDVATDLYVKSIAAQAGVSTSVIQSQVEQAYKKRYEIHLSEYHEAQHAEALRQIRARPSRD